MVGGVGEVLGLQADSLTGVVLNAVLAGHIQGKGVGGIQLYAGQGGQGLHANAGLGAGEPGHMAQAAVRNDKAVIVAAAQLQGGVIGLDITADGLFLAEIHGGPGGGDQLAGGDQGVVGLQESGGVHLQAVAQDGAGSVTVEVEVAVVGDVHHGGGVGGAAVLDHQGAAHQAVLHFQGHVAGETVGTVGAFRPQQHAVVTAVGKLHIEHHMVEALVAAVQAVAVVVLGQVILLGVQVEPRAADAVGVAAHHRAQVAGVFLVAGHIVKAQHHVHGVAFAVFHDQLLQGAGIAQDMGFDNAVVQYGYLDGGAVAGMAEITNMYAHGQGPPSFLGLGGLLLFGGGGLMFQVVAHAGGHAAGAVVQHAVHAGNSGAGSTGLPPDLTVYLALYQAAGHIIALFQSAKFGHGTQIVKKADALLQIVQPQDGFIQSGAARLIRGAVLVCDAHGRSPLLIKIRSAVRKGKTHQTC